jgi:hypothetical protein
MTLEPRQLYLLDGENADEARRATAQLGDLRDGTGGRVGGGTAQGGRRDVVQRASGGTTVRRAGARGTACRGEGRGVQGLGARRAGRAWGVGLGGVAAWGSAAWRGGAGGGGGVRGGGGVAWGSTAALL